MVAYQVELVSWPVHANLPVFILEIQTERISPITMSNDLKTDDGETVHTGPLSEERHPTKPQRPRPKDPEKKIDVKEVANSGGCNCHGFTFSMGKFQIAPEEIDKILAANYKKKDKKKAEVCCIVVYSNEQVGTDIPNVHSGLVVEVDDKTGEPKSVRSKSSGSGGLFDHPTDIENYDKWDLYCRNTDKFDDRKKKELDELAEKYKKVEKDKGPSSPEAHNAAAALCQAKNALAGV